MATDPRPGRKERALLDRFYDRMQPPRRLRFTREGWFYLFFTLGVGTAALNTGNNLLFLVLGLQLTAIIISGILSEIALQKLTLTRLGGSEPVAREPFALRYEVHNAKRFWPSLTLTLQEKDAPFGGGRATVLSIPAGSSASGSAEATIERRGLYPLRYLTVSTRFPFGFFEKERDLPVPGELCVLPARRPAPERMARGGYRDGERPEGRVGNGAEFLGLREARPGDDRRSVHWLKSAAAGKLLVVERERERRRRVVLVIDNRGPLEGEWLERPIEDAAAMARLLCQRGLEVGLATSGVFVPPAGGSAALKQILRRLAVLSAVERGPGPDAHREGTLHFGRAAKEAA